MQTGKEPDPINSIRHITDPTDPDRQWLVDYGKGNKPDATAAEAALRFARINDPNNARDIAPYLARLDDLADQVRSDLAALLAKSGHDTVASAKVAPDNNTLAPETLAQASIEQIVSTLQSVIPTRHGFQGDAENYDDMENADLMKVMDRKRGLPVALAMLYIHVARRCDFTITGIDFPGHFLLRLQSNGKRRMIDPFHGGIALGPAELRELLKSFSGLDAELEPRHYCESSDVSILLRLQNNIKVRALRAGELTHATRIIEHSLLIAPDHEGLWHQLGALYARLNEDHKALGAFEQFVALCEDPLHRTRIEAVIEELRDRLGLDVLCHTDGLTTTKAPAVTDDDSVKNDAKDNAPIPLYPNLMSVTNTTNASDTPSSSDH
ncbi:SirB1 family protein [Thalassospira lohafexi]|uniref:Protein SirB1 N-terminal domain-containing protein n=1 Tax=Thalassospira lohafexi TaxID=744227 RepID=A0A2N3L8X8_9PROT|nr:transglutaminase-like domain-containing protein [Thalassospira lohafexi]PKR59180.1 hypothetical protein COO92_09125 [Thalassospira lohafexi]